MKRCDGFGRGSICGNVGENGVYRVELQEMLRLDG